MASMTVLAVTVLGHDRPGIIAQATSALGEVGLNLEDSTMTLLRGHFAFMLICSGDAGVDEVAAALAPLTDDGLLEVSVREVQAEPERAGNGTPHQLVVHGGDRPGIVSALTSVIAEAGGNVTDLSTRLSGELYVVIAEVDMPDDADIDAVASRLARVAAGLGVGAALRPVDTDLL
jgi:glycine cleavage system transcriptional repressor